MMDNQQDATLWHTLMNVTIVLACIAAVTAAVKAIRNAWHKSTDWVASQVKEAVNKELK